MTGSARTSTRLRQRARKDAIASGKRQPGDGVTDVATRQEKYLTQAANSDTPEERRTRVTDLSASASVKPVRNPDARPTVRANVNPDVEFTLSQAHSDRVTRCALAVHCPSEHAPAAAPCWTWTATHGHRGFCGARIDAGLLALARGEVKP